jgi:uncharacterized protein (DUF362 family)
MKKISRRSFFKKGLAIGAVSMCGGGMLSPFPRTAPGVVHAAKPVDLSIARGRNYFKSTIKAVEQLGGMRKVVSRDSRVGLLVNSPFKNYGAYVNPEITLAVVKMCFEAGAKEIWCLKEPSGGYWQRSKLADEYAEEIKSLKEGWEDTVDFQIPQAVSLKEATVRKKLLECDLFINVAISKNHSGTHFSCLLKNMMGTSTFGTNLGMHYGGKKGLSWYPDIPFLSQCIADLNLIRKPDLCIVDSTEFLMTNGPYGPGELMKAQKVLAGTDRVLMDAYCSTLLNLKPENVVMIQKAAAHNLGSLDLKKANIVEVEAG